MLSLDGASIISLHRFKIHCLTLRVPWYNKAIGASSSIEDMGVFQWHLCLVLGLAWIVLYLFVNRGVQSAGKVS